MIAVQYLFCHVHLK